jgi:hypothetical protein
MIAKKNKRTRPPSKSVRNQADRIFEDTVCAEVVARDLIRRFACRIEDQHARGILHLDYRMIAKALTAADPETKSDNQDDPPKHGMCERYACHFQNQNKRREFFAELDLIAKRNCRPHCFLPGTCHTARQQNRGTQAVLGRNAPSS